MATFPDYFLAASEDRVGLSKLSKVWMEMGYSEESLLNRQDTVNKHVSELIGEMLAEEEGAKSDIIQKIEGLLQEADMLSKELKTQIKIVCDENLPLLDMEIKVKDQLKDYREIKKTRLGRLNVLLKEEDELISALCIPKYAQVAEVPSDEELIAFEAHLRSKAVEKARLEELFLTTRDSIQTIMKDLGIVQTSAFEKAVCTGICGFQLSQENMTKLKDLHQNLVDRQTEAKALAYQLREKTSQLWERLNEAADHREAFVNRYVGHTADTMRALKAEIQRCELKKRENIKHFVQAVRTELATWWDRCHYSDEQRKKFKHFTCDYFNEDLLDIHEQEVNTVQTFYKDNEHIFDLIATRQQTWDKMVELDELSSKPGRLFNRGGKLLQEENERKKIKSALPRLDGKLEKLIGAYEATKGKPFLYEGSVYLKDVKQQWADFEQRKEFDKLARKARNNQGDVTASLHKSGHKSASGSALKRKVGTPGPSADQKRSRANTPAQPVAARRLNAPAQAAATNSQPRVVASKVPVRSRRDRQSRSKQVKRKIFDAAKTSVKKVEQQQPDLLSNFNQPNETYTHFENNNKKGCQSTKLDFSELLGEDANAQLRKASHSLKDTTNIPAAQGKANQDDSDDTCCK